MTQRDPSEIALSFYNNTFESNHKQYLSIISSAEFNAVRKEYLQLFDWSSSVLESLRLLTDKLFFRGESQHIDTILQDFADSWFNKFRHIGDVESFGNSNGVYLVSYSLILLNTDLHTVADTGSRKHISKPDYVKNTLNALQSNKIQFNDRQKIELELKNYYDSLMSNELKLLGSKNKKDSDSIYSSNSSTLTSPPQLNAATARSFGFASLLLNERSLKKQPSRESVGSNFTNSQTTVYTMKTGITTSQLSNLNELDNESDYEESLQNLIIEEEGDLELELDGPPWIKEGLLNVIMIDNDQEHAKSHGKFSFLKSKPTNLLSKWKNGFVVVSKGELRIFSFDTQGHHHQQQQQPVMQNQRLKQKRSVLGLTFGSSHVTRQSHDNLFELPETTMSNEPVGAGNWYDTAHCLGLFPLSHTYASKPTPLVLQSLRMNRSEPVKNMGHVYWTLTLPLQNSNCKKHTKLVFQCGSEEIAREFIESCNFWGARSTNVPSEITTMSSYEYGWSRNLLKLIDLLNCNRKDPNTIRELNTIKITDWSPLLTSNLPTNLVMSDQLQKLKTYHKSLKLQLEDHQMIKPRLDILNKIVQENKLQTHHHHHPQSAFSLRRRQEPPPSTNELNINVRLIINNYNKKLNHLNRESLKYKKYLNSLSNAIRVRREKLAEDMDSSENDVTNDSNKIYEDDEFGANNKIIMVGTD